ncbi:unnamed protein product [Brassica napus]|uniref:glycerophosphodiester phosphodiesterase n=2 Tax=Brassica TaxID=3705 RepID=A0A816W4C1_BRANA|nr:unnamed protein product [Brassica napus]
MHDFCFTIPYGLLLIGGGFIGYLKKGSITSFAGGAGAGLLLILAGYLSLNAFKKKKTSTIAVVLQTVISAALTLVMGQRYLLTQKIMPAGLVAVISALMTCFYVYKIATGGNKIPSKAAEQRLRQDSCMNIKTGDKQGRLKLQESRTSRPLVKHSGCFSHLDTKEDEEPAVVTIISKDGASGDFPGCTDLAYEKAVKDGVDILDCNVQMSKDKIPFCMSSIDLLNTTNVFDTSFRNLSSTVAEIQPKSGIYTFSLTMSQIKTLKPVITNPKEDHALFRNPRNKNVGKFLTLSEFLFLANRYNSLLGVLIKVENAVYLAKHQGISVVDAVLNKTERLSTQEGQTTSIAIMFQSTDKSVLMDFKKKKLIYPDELVYRVDEDIRDVTDSAIKEIMSFAGTIVISKESVLPYNGGLVKKKTDVVARLKASGFRVYVETFSNEFVTQPFDLFSDSTVEINFFVQGVKIDGIITDFPATTARYRKSQCYREMGMFRTGELLPFANPRLLSPAQAPYPLLVESDVMEPPLPDVKSKNSTPTKAMAKAIQVFSPVRTMAVLVIFFISV